MDSEAKGLIVVTAILTVLYALWTEYFSQSLDRAKEEKRELDKNAELSKLRMAGICMVFCQFGLFLSSSEVRTAHPLAANFSFIAAMLIQGILQARLERKIGRKPEEAAADVKEGLRALLWSSVAGLTYLAVLCTLLFSSFFLAELTHASLVIKGTMVFAGAILGVVGGLGFNFALGGFFLRKTLPSVKLTDVELERTLNERFADAGITPPGFWVIETNRTRFANAMIAGFPRGRGIFKAALLISRNVVSGLTPDEIQAVVRHEIAHITLEHLRKRFQLACMMILASTAASTLFVLVMNILIPGSQTLLGIIAAVIASFYTFRTLAKQNYFHEIEADVHSIDHLGGNFEDYASALRKLAKLNGFQETNQTERVFAGAGHPATENRIKITRNYLEKKYGAVPEKGANPGSKQLEAQEKEAA